MEWGGVGMAWLSFDVVGARIVLTDCCSVFNGSSTAHGPAICSHFSAPVLSGAVVHKLAYGRRRHQGCLIDWKLVPGHFVNTCLQFGPIISDVCLLHQFME